MAIHYWPWIHLRWWKQTHLYVLHGCCGHDHRGRRGHQLPHLHVGVHLHGRDHGHRGRQILLHWHDRDHHDHPLHGRCPLKRQQ